MPDLSKNLYFAPCANRGKPSKYCILQRHNQNPRNGAFRKNSQRFKLLTTFAKCFMLKLVFAIFSFFHQMTAPKYLWKMLFISYNKLSFLIYSNFCISIFPSLFFPHDHCFRGWSAINLQVYDVINCLSKNLLIHFV